MIALRTSLNGRQLCLAGAEDLCVLNSIVNAVGKLGPLSNPQRHADDSPDLFLSVGGLTARTDSDDEHLRWTEHQELSVGDQILISVVEVSEADLPITRTHARSAIEDHERHRYEEAKKTYFELRSKYDFKGEIDDETNQAEQADVGNRAKPGA